MFDLDEFVAACVAGQNEADPRRAVKETLDRALRDAEAIAERLQPERAGISLLHHTPELTIINVVWAPGMRLFPHDHRMWAVIGVYAGQEDNEFFRRDPRGTGLVPSTGKTLKAGDLTVLGDATIHAVSNPRTKPTGGIHVYGGDFVNQPRSQWPPPDNTEQPYDPDTVTQLFEAANNGIDQTQDG